MKKFIIVFIIIILAAVGVVLALKDKPKTETFNEPAASSNQTSNTPMEIKSPAFAANQNIPAKYTCDGQNINPPLQFNNVPADAKSLALVVTDPDAPSGNWTHWLVWNIDPSVKEITENSVPATATQGTTSFGSTGYGGPCPPSGQHRYVFKLYALDKKLTLPSYSTDKDFFQAINGSVISQAELTGVYGR